MKRTNKEPMTRKPPKVLYEVFIDTTVKRMVSMNSNRLFGDNEYRRGDSPYVVSHGKVYLKGAVTGKIDGWVEYNRTPWFFTFSRTRALQELATVKRGFRFGLRHARRRMAAEIDKQLGYVSPRRKR